MAVIVTPPETERRPRRTDEYDGGHGRRPPNGRDLKRTGGGGDNDGWNGPSGPNRRPGSRLRIYRLNLFLVLCAVMMFFIGIVSVFFVTRSAAHIDAYNHYVRTWLPTRLPPILWINTAILLVSSFTVELARRRMFDSIDAMEEWFGLGKPISRRALPWLAATLALGLTFVAGQIAAWRQLAIEGAPFHSRSNSADLFYIITGAHALHLLAGIVGLIIAIRGLYSFKNVENRQIMVDCTAWYWHSMGVLWLFLFAMLLLCQ
jgi:cytochrome c oxidase subunit 3